MSCLHILLIFQTLVDIVLTPDLASSGPANDRQVQMVMPVFLPGLQKFGLLVNQLMPVSEIMGYRGMLVLSQCSVVDVRKSWANVSPSFSLRHQPQLQHGVIHPRTVLAPVVASYYSGVYVTVYVLLCTHAVVYVMQSL